MTDPAPPAPGGFRRYLPEIAALLTVVMWAVGYMATKTALNEIHPLSFIAVRYSAMTVLAFAVMLGGRALGRGGAITIRRPDWPRVIAASLFGMFLYQLGYVEGLARTSPFAASLLIGLIPVATMVLLALVGERPPRLAWVGVLVAVLGSAVFLSGRDTAGTTLLGNVLCLAAAVAFAAYGIVNRPVVRSYPAGTWSAWELLASTIPFLVVGARSVADEDWGAVDLHGWLAIGYMVVFPAYIAYMFWNYAIRERGATVASSFGLLTPILSGVLSVIVFDEIFGVAKVIGAALVLAGLALIRAGMLRGAKTP